MSRASHGLFEDRSVITIVEVTRLRTSNEKGKKRKKKKETRCTNRRGTDSVANREYAVNPLGRRSGCRRRYNCVRARARADPRRCHDRSPVVDNSGVAAAVDACGGSRAVFHQPPLHRRTRWGLVTWGDGGVGSGGGGRRGGACGQGEDHLASNLSAPRSAFLWGTMLHTIGLESIAPRREQKLRPTCAADEHMFATFRSTGGKYAEGFGIVGRASI